ncbi:hypothetical protein [Sandaracinus amylolyticus]|uniref:hypothetical protein n=1 Tax=Sandaracinus amylolyticus TaxID=927083 RepID=UPI001F19AFF6|nr:hypothetical protein [Sandaracinus amylolyticus]UJR82634.1 Hypothetical protein I5071_46990 [Sandaracinus amylolyticus]
MSRVVLLSHDGVRCALPASQVVRAVGSGGEDERPVALFRREPDASVRDARSLLVRTGAGERRVDCADARFDWLSEERLFALPELLRDAMALPHVVGVAEMDGVGLVWLVDLDLFSGSSAR